MRFVILAIVLVTSAAAAQEPQGFTPFPGASAAAYRFDLERNFYATPAAADSARLKLIDRFRALPVRPSYVGQARELHVLLATMDTLGRELGKQYAYLSLRWNIDTRDVAAQQEMSGLARFAEPVIASIQRAVGALDDRQFQALANTEPALRRYAYDVSRARMVAQHRFDDSTERALRPAENEAATWGPSLFQRTVASIPFGSVRAPEGELDVRRQGNAIWNHASREVREAGYRRNQASLRTRVDTFAFILSRQAALRQNAARQRRWPDYPTQTFAERALTPAQVRGLLEALMRRGELNKRAERARIASLRAELGYDTVHVWDLSAPPPGMRAPRYTIAEASRIILEAAAPLGNAYVRELRVLLDPRNGRLDLIPRENRVDRPGFSTGSVGYPSMFFQGRFEGFVDDLTILTHEAGHAVQNMLMDSAGVLPRHAFGPSYFTESFAIFSEYLLLRHLSRTAPDSLSRLYFSRKLQDKALDVFRNGWESLLEMQIFDSASAGRALSAETVERMTQDVASRVSIWFGPGGERELAWLQPLQLYTWPLYRVNYVIASLLALRYMDLLDREPATFAARYGALLRNGYDAPPDDLLRRFLGFEMSDSDALVDAALRTIERLK